jgi:uncharacterized membrane protein YkoI
MAGKKFLVSLFILVLATAASTIGQEKLIKKADLPNAVRKTAEEQTRGATVRGYTEDTEDGKLEYEIELLIDGHTKDLTIDPSGTLVEIEEQVVLDKLPTEVREGLHKKIGNGRITKVESISKRGKLVAYEAQVLTGGKRSEVQVGPDGKSLDHEE